MPKVYITQENGGVDYMPATKFGDLVFVSGSNQRFSPHKASLDNKLIINQIENMLKDFNVDEDYLLCTGSPTIMAVCGFLIPGDKLRILNWDNRSRDYFEVIV